MKKKSRRLATAAAAFGTVLMLTACGSKMASETAAYSSEVVTEAAEGMYDQGNVTYHDYASEDIVTQEAAAEEMPSEKSAGAGNSAGEIPNAESAGADSISKKLIKNVDLEAETRKFDELVSNINAEVEALGGYVESFNVSGYAGETARWGSITARVPADKLDIFSNKVGEQSNITYRNEYVQDVTLTYVDLDAHKKALIAERDRLMELLEKAETVADIIEIEGRLSEVRYQIESMESQLRTIDNQVNYSTVHVNIREVELFTPKAEESVLDEIAAGFRNNVEKVLSDMKDIGIGLIISLPFLIAWAIVILILALVVWLVLKLFRHIRRKRKQKKAQLCSQETDYIEIPPVREEEPDTEKSKE